MRTIITAALSVGALSLGAAAASAQVSWSGMSLPHGASVDSSGVSGAGLRAGFGGLHMPSGGGAGLSISDSDRTATLDCKGGPASILGSDNTLTLTNCSKVSTLGTHNKIVVSLAPHATVSTAGSHNEIIYTAPSGAGPSVSTSGTDDKVSGDS